MYYKWPLLYAEDEECSWPELRRGNTRYIVLRLGELSYSPAPVCPQCPLMPLGAAPRYVAITTPVEAMPRHKCVMRFLLVRVTESWIVPPPSRTPAHLGPLLVGDGLYFPPEHGKIPHAKGRASVAVSADACPHPQYSPRGPLNTTALSWGHLVNRQQSSAGNARCRWPSTQAPHQLPVCHPQLHWYVSAQPLSSMHWTWSS